MRVSYDIRRWHDHRSANFCRSCQKGTLRTSSLASYGFGSKGLPPLLILPTSSLTSQSSKSVRLQLPCPGLTASSDKRIPTYLGHSTALGGGARSRPILAAELFNGRLWRDLPEHEQRVVLRREELEFKWRNSRATGAVYSVKCLRDVYVASRMETLEPCSACSDVLHLRTFQTRINVPMPAEEDMCFVPEGHRCPELGNIYLKYKGVRELVEKVWHSLQRIF
jgi:hypothetical protein